ncbi:epoxide hydrolase family protein [Gordonia rhizosphera]|uniref:Putative epoxide hydrolase n=1 Tax=Gordonia rhizosphera NBRC 16068 TaxID=1108045 RepID=K6WNR6_9ACTN|nr:epoxide hydrolase family protein [Gordonia rhizosphera]GAB93767.1 putative epoxide hydrolase [Gordonia rhizosphera NBRC 16068]
MSDSGGIPQEFVLRTDPAVIDDLRARLRATHWPEGADGFGWTLGVDVAYLQELVAYWIDEFDWYAQESAINRLPHFLVEVGGLHIHAMHVKSASPAPALPLLLNHGWPDSFWRYLKVIDLLTDPAAHGADPADAFAVVVPDMPGFGYSDRPIGAPLDTRAVAGLWADLMGAFGYDRFVTAGGDMGSHVSRFLALDHPDRITAVHRTDAGVPVFTGDPADLTPSERAWLTGAAQWGAVEGAYAAMQRTKPQTAAVGLTDSPAGLAAWIVEKLHGWSDCGGVVERAFTKDEILTLVTQYWVTGTIGSSMRTYHANAAIPLEQHARRVEVPSGFSIFGGDVVRPPRAWLERVANTVYFSEPERGGHFAPFEEPELYAQELRTFFRRYRQV